MALASSIAPAAAGDLLFPSNRGSQLFEATISKFLRARGGHRDVRIQIEVRDWAARAHHPRPNRPHAVTRTRERTNYFNGFRFNHSTKSLNSRYVVSAPDDILRLEQMKWRM